MELRRRACRRWRLPVAVYATDAFRDDGKAREVRQCVGNSARTDTLAYDTRGRLTAWRTAASGPLGDDADETAHFRRYDALDQVTAEDAARWPLGRNDFPDADGALPGRAPLDRTAERSFERVHSDGVVERVRDRVSGQLVELAPDAAGRSTSHTERFRALDLSRDAQGRPARDAYDAEGRRLGTALQGEALVYDAYGLVEHTRAGATRVFAPPLPGVQLSRRADGQWEAALLTPTQTPLAVVGPGGAMRLQALYSPTGEATESRSANDTAPYPKTWAGYLRYPDRGQFGETAGLYDAGARLYAPTWGQFLEGDPVLPEADAPETWGRYAYGGGDTFGRWDPDGRFAWLISGGIGAAIGGGLGFAACALQGGDDCLSAAGIGAAAGFVSGATFGLAQMAGAGAIAAGAASGGAGGAISGGATAWKNGGDAGDIARAALIHGLGGALGGGIAGQFGVRAATMGAGRALFAEVTGNVAGELAAQSVSVAFGQSSGVDWRSVAISAAVGAAPSAWRVAAGVGRGAHHETPSAHASAGAVGKQWRLDTDAATDLSAFGRKSSNGIFELPLDAWGDWARLRSAEVRATFGASTSTDYRRTFFEAYPSAEGSVVVHHAVEQQVLDRHPGLVTISEIHSIENLRGIPKSLNADIHLSQIRKAWNRFYKQTPSPMKQQLLDYATKLDDQFGHLFEPPVRKP